MKGKNMYQKIKILCKEKKKSINSLEKELGFGTGTISRWKKSAAGIDKVVLVAKKLDTTVDFLLGTEDISESKTKKIFEKISKLSNNQFEQLEIYLKALGGNNE